MKYAAPAMERKRVTGMMNPLSASCATAQCAPGQTCIDTPNGPNCVNN